MASHSVSRARRTRTSSARAFSWSSSRWRSGSVARSRAFHSSCRWASIRWTSPMRSSRPSRRAASSSRSFLTRGSSSVTSVSSRLHLECISSNSAVRRVTSRWASKVSRACDSSADFQSPSRFKAEPSMSSSVSCSRCRAWASADFCAARLAISCPTWSAASSRSVMRDLRTPISSPILCTWSSSSCFCMSASSSCRRAFCSEPSCPSTRALMRCSMRLSSCT
mmetsp:Transcript_7563/g.13364  ORF Transcript_7563/g.13364 Transcript_7563/m.13364 type:complete len:223 (-) Transcript_7563:970-1638(-)